MCVCVCIYIYIYIYIYKIQEMLYILNVSYVKIQLRLYRVRHLFTHLTSLVYLHTSENF